MRRNCWNCRFNGQGPSNCGNEDASYEWSHTVKWTEHPNGMNMPPKSSDGCPGFKAREVKRS